jgi:hypothetical protein
MLQILSPRSAESLHRDSSNYMNRSVPTPAPSFQLAFRPRFFAREWRNLWLQNSSALYSKQDFVRVANSLAPGVIRAVECRCSSRQLRLRSTPTRSIVWGWLSALTLNCVTIKRFMSMQAYLSGVEIISLKMAGMYFTRDTHITYIYKSISLKHENQKRQRCTSLNPAPIFTTFAHAEVSHAKYYPLYSQLPGWDVY